MNSLSDKDIREILQKYNIPINGIYTKDHLPPLKGGFTVINLDDVDGAGTHWTGIYKTSDSSIIYFDAFGFPAPEQIEDQLYTYIINNKQIQDVNTSSCGYYVIAFFKFMKSKSNPYKAFKSFTDLWSSNTKLNEIILNSLLN